MISKHILDSKPPRRLPKKGFLFTLVRFVGLILEIVGLLLLGIALIGFCLTLARSAPTFVGTIRHIDQQTSGFIFLMLLGYLLIFPIIGLVAAAIAGTGLALHFIGTERRVNNDHQIGQIIDVSTRESPTKSDG